MAKAAQRGGPQRNTAQRSGTQKPGTQAGGTQKPGTQSGGTQERHAEGRHAEAGHAEERHAEGRRGSRARRSPARSRAARRRAGPSAARASGTPRPQERSPANEDAARRGPAGAAAPGWRGNARCPPAPAGPPAWLRWSTFALAILGLAASAYLTYTHFTDSALAGCTETSGAVNCGKVTTSPQSVVFGIPVAVLGLAFYVFLVAIMSPYAWRSARREIALARMASLVVGIGFVLYLVYAELFDIGAICLYCTSVHVITFLLFVLTGLAVAIWGLGPRTARS